MALLTCKNLNVGYDGKIVASNINFSIEKGTYLCVIGENGSGKSTLMKTILGLIPPSSGEITFSDSFSRKQIGYLPQQNAIQRTFPASVREIVLSGCLNHMHFPYFYRKEDKERAAFNIARLGITHLASKCYRELSGGQQQRVLLARALCSASSMLLLDEPATGLDPDATESMYEIVRKLNQEGMAIMMISHDLEQVDKYASHILKIGKEVSFSNVRDY